MARGDRRQGYASRSRGGRARPRRARARRACGTLNDPAALDLIATAECALWSPDRSQGVADADLPPHAASRTSRPVGTGHPGGLQHDGADGRNPRPPQPGAVSSAQCDADRAAWAIGQQASAEVMERIRADTGSSKARLIRPGQMVTMEYDGTRVNVDVDDRNVITAVRCG
ncbi:I78 family peptidase inhibitor [Vulcaniibacterium thermophilum]|uniref:I78 family peptidase inhibitor n=1 Tax=Vulcaniibacterium thermophilum TaxID=1169913 RepID=UPI003610E189